MRIALPVWEDSVSTVFDSAKTFAIVETEQEEALRRKEESFDGEDILLKIRKLTDEHIELVICGALSREFSELLLMHGIEKIEGIHGKIEDVIDAYLTGSLLSIRFYMAGCDHTLSKQANIRTS